MTLGYPLDWNEDLSPNEDEREGKKENELHCLRK